MLFSQSLCRKPLRRRGYFGWWIPCALFLPQLHFFVLQLHCSNWKQCYDRIVSRVPQPLWALPAAQQWVNSSPAAAQSRRNTRSFPRFLCFSRRPWSVLRRSQPWTKDTASLDLAWSAGKCSLECSTWRIRELTPSRRSGSRVKKCLACILPRFTYAVLLCAKVSLMRSFSGLSHLHIFFVIRLPS